MDDGSRSVSSFGSRGSRLGAPLKGKLNRRTAKRYGMLNNRSPSNLSLADHSGLGIFGNDTPAGESELMADATQANIQSSACSSAIAGKNGLMTGATQLVQSSAGQSESLDGSKLLGSGFEGVEVDDEGMPMYEIVIHFF